MYVYSYTSLYISMYIYNIYIYIYIYIVYCDSASVESTRGKEGEPSMGNEARPA